MSARFESKVASYGWLRTVVVCIVVIVAVFWVLTFAFDRYLVSASGSHPYSGLVAVDDNQCLLSEGGEKARWNVILDDGQHTAGVLTGEVSAVSLDDWAGRDSQSLRCLDSEELAERQERARLGELFANSEACYHPEGGYAEIGTEFPHRDQYGTCITGEEQEVSREHAVSLAAEVDEIVATASAWPEKAGLLVENYCATSSSRHELLTNEHRLIVADAYTEAYETGRVYTPGVHREFSEAVGHWCGASVPTANPEHPVPPMPPKDPSGYFTTPPSSSGFEG